jgi:hypothetical protein
VIWGRCYIFFAPGDNAVNRRGESLQAGRDPRRYRAVEAPIPARTPRRGRPKIQRRAMGMSGRSLSTVGRLGSARRLACLAALLTAGCAGDGPTVSLKSDDPAGRIPAMKQAAQRHDAKAIPELVARLESDDPAERLYAIGALERITGKTFGYRYYGTDVDRADAVGRWKEWLAGQQKK